MKMDTLLTCEAHGRRWGAGAHQARRASARESGPAPVGPRAPGERPPRRRRENGPRCFPGTGRCHGSRRGISSRNSSARASSVGPPRARRNKKMTHNRIFPSQGVKPPNHNKLY